MSTIRLDIATPERKVYSDDVNMIIVKGVVGDLGILPNHAPLATPLAISILTIKKETEVIRIAISGGFLEVGSNKAIILADAAELPEDIDVERAREAMRRAEQRLANKSNEELDVIRAQSAMNRALNRINLVENK
jgi:F-type H+-transporting ATPase subunit epsilon